MQIFKILDDLFNQLHWLFEQFHPDIILIILIMMLHLVISATVLEFYLFQFFPFL